MSEYDDLLDFEDEGATITGERPTASGNTDVTAPVSVTDQAEAIEKTKEVRAISTSGPDDDALRPPPLIKTPEDVPPALEWVDRMKTDREWLLRRAGRKK